MKESVVEKPVYTGAGMWALWDFSQYQEIVSFDERENRYILVKSDEYLLEANGAVILSGIENINKDVLEEECIRVDLDKGSYSVTIYLIDWESEPDMTMPDGSPSPDALPDFIVCIQSLAETSETYRKELDTFKKCEPFPFADDPDTAVITCCHIIEDDAAITYVSHDEEDGMWQFLCSDQHGENEARIVSLFSIYEKDSSVAELADMPCGYYAERKDKDSGWIIGKG